MKCRNDEELIQNLEGHQRAFEIVAKTYDERDEHSGNIQFGISLRDLKRFLEVNDLQDHANSTNLYLANKESAININDFISKIIEEVKNRQS